MRQDLDVHHRVAGGGDAAAALALEPQHLAILDAGGDRHVQLPPVMQHQAAGGAGGRLDETDADA